LYLLINNKHVIRSENGGPCAAFIPRGGTASDIFPLWMLICIDSYRRQFSRSRSWKEAGGAFGNMRRYGGCPALFGLRVGINYEKVCCLHYNNRTC